MVMVAPSSGQPSHGLAIAIRTIAIAIAIAAKKTIEYCNMQ